MMCLLLLGTWLLGTGHLGGCCHLSHLDIYFPFPQNTWLQCKDGPFREKCAALFSFQFFPTCSLPSNPCGKICRLFSITSICLKSWLTTASALRTKPELVKTHLFPGRWQIDDLPRVCVSVCCKVLACMHVLWNCSRNNCFVVLFDRNNTGWKVRLRLTFILSVHPRIFKLRSGLHPSSGLYPIQFTGK